MKIDFAQKNKADFIKKPWFLGWFLQKVVFRRCVLKYKKHDFFFQIRIFGSLCHIKIIISKMFQILTIHDI